MGLLTGVVLPVDFQVAFPQEVIRVNQVRAVPGMPVRTLDVIGEDFRSVDEVRINEIEATDIAVISRTRLLVQVPDVLKTSTITSVSVLSQRLTITPKSYIRFRISRTPSKVRGILKLMQSFLLMLFRTPGTDIFAPKLGGGALRVLGQNFGKEEGGDIVSSFIVSVDNTARQLIQIQSRNPSLPPDERLLSANVLQAGYNKNETALVAGIELLSQAGRAATARVEL